MKQDKQFAKGALLIAISAILVKVIGIVYKIPLSYILSDEGMGYFNSAYTIFSFFYIVAGAGVPKAISIIISNADGELNLRKSKRVFSTALKFFTLCGLVCTLIFLLLSRPISIFLKNDAAFLSMIFIAPSVFFICASSVIRGYFTGKMRFIPCAVSELIASLGKLAFGLCFAIIAVRLTNDMTLISAATIFGTTIGAFLSWLYLYISAKNRAEYKSEEKVHTLFSPELKEILSLSLPLTLSAFISSLGNVLDLAIIMRTLSSDGYTPYQASVIYGNYSTMVIPMLNSVSAVVSPLLLLIVPLVGRDRALKNSKGTVKFIIKGTLWVSAFLSVALLFESKNLLSFLFEDTGAILASPTLSYMSLGIFLMCLLMIVNTVLEGAGEVKIPLLSLVAATVIKAILSLFLLRNDVLGIKGASVSIAVSYCISLFISSFALMRQSELSNLKIFKSALSSLFIALGAYAIVNYLFARLNVNLFMLKLSIFFVIFTVFDYLFTFNRAEKTKIWSKLTKK